MLDPLCHLEQIAGNVTANTHKTGTYPRLVFDEPSPAVAGRTNSFRLKVSDGFRGPQRWVVEARPPRANGAGFRAVQRASLALTSTSMWRRRALASREYSTPPTSAARCYELIFGSRT